MMSSPLLSLSFGCHSTVSPPSLPSPIISSFCILNQPSAPRFSFISSTRAAPSFCYPVFARKAPTFTISSSLSATMATGVKEVLPPALTSTSVPPQLFDGTTRLYLSYTCPFAQRVWITRNCKGLQDQIKLVFVDLQDRPAWYKEKVNPTNKVPALEHNNEIKVESLDLIKYIEENFGGPSLLPDEPVKREFADELFSYTDTFTKSVFGTFKEEGDDKASASFDEIEKALSKFEDGPFFLGQFSLVDIAYAPFIERFRPYLLEVKKMDITEGRPKLATWIQEMEKNEAYAQTRRDPKDLVESYKKRFGPAL